jgi:adenosine kinase
MAALGNDGGEYTARLEAWGLDTSLLRHDTSTYTAQAIIITDRDNNQITAFHPGAMTNAHLMRVPPARARPDLAIGIIAPDGRDAMWQHASQLHAAGIPFVFDPGQGLPMFDGDELKRFVEMATWVAVNDYEGRMLCERTGQTLEQLSRSHLQGVIVTLGAAGCELWIQGERTVVPGHAATEVVDPTGCGDAFRGGLLYGLERGWTLARSVALGNRLGALKIACRGGQNHAIDDAVRAEIAA